MCHRSLHFSSWPGFPAAVRGEGWICTGADSVVWQKQLGKLLPALAPPIPCCLHGVLCARPTCRSCIDCSCPEDQVLLFLSFFHQSCLLKPEPLSPILCIRKRGLDSAALPWHTYTSTSKPRPVAALAFWHQVTWWAPAGISLLKSSSVTPVPLPSSASLWLTLPSARLRDCQLHSFIHKTCSSLRCPKTAVKFLKASWNSLLSFFSPEGKSSVETRCLVWYPVTAGVVCANSS